MASRHNLRLSRFNVTAARFSPVLADIADPSLRRLFLHAPAVARHRRSQRRGSTNQSTSPSRYRTAQSTPLELAMHRRNRHRRSSYPRRPTVDLLGGQQPNLARRILNGPASTKTPTSFRGTTFEFAVTGKVVERFRDCLAPISIRGDLSELCRCNLIFSGVCVRPQQWQHSGDAHE